MNRVLEPPRKLLLWGLLWSCLLASVAGLHPACTVTPPNLEGWTCTSNLDCLSPLICDSTSGKCLIPCFNDSDCKESSCINSFCALKDQVDSGPGPDQCNPQAKEECNGKDDNCNGQIDEIPTCHNVGEVCDLSASPDPHVCKPGLVCEAFTVAHPRICIRVCNPQAPTPCPTPGFKCLGLASGKHGCIESPCSKATPCKFNTPQVPHSCDNIGQGTILCRPYFPSGNIDYGASCSPTEGKHCKSPLVCVRRNTKFLGFCTSRCGQDQDCSSLKAGSKCLPLENKFRICFPPCTLDSDCTSEQRCQSGVCSY